MKRWHTREDSGIVLDREGRWWHDGEPVEHPKVVAAFDAGLQPAEEGRFKLVIGGDWCFVQVQGAAYRVVDAWAEPNRMALRLSDGSRELLDPTTLSVDGSGVLNCRVKEGRALARLSRTAQVQVGTRLELDRGMVMLVLDEARLATSLPEAALGFS